MAKSKLKPSSVDESVRYMQNPQCVISLDFINGEQRDELERHLRSIAKRNGYPSIVLKRESGKLYAF